jgi:dolichyl-phosphate beta-glucosyltransferase
VPFLSIVIPAYNEERRLPASLHRLHDYLSQQSYAWEIIVVSNGCTDRTDAVVREAAQTIPHLRLLTLVERGKGLACREGALDSHGEIVFLCDADLSMPPGELALFLQAIEQVDVVVGSREAPGSHRYNEPWHRHLMGRVFNWLVQVVAVKGIQDTQCGFKAFRRPAAQELFSRQVLHGFGFDVELLYLAQKFGYTMQELPIDWYFDADTRVRPGIDSLAMMEELFMLKIRDLLGRYRPSAPRATRGGDVAR